MGSPVNDKKSLRAIGGDGAHRRFKGLWFPLSLRFRRDLIEKETLHMRLLVEVENKRAMKLFSGHRLLFIHGNVEPRTVNAEP